VESSRTLRAIARDKSKRHIEAGVVYVWRVLEGAGRIEPEDGEFVTLHATSEPCLLRVGVTASQQRADDDTATTTCTAEALVTVTDSILPPSRTDDGGRRGLPGYTLQNAPGKLWRSRYDGEHNVIVVNSGHRDYVYAARTRALKLRYLVRLFAKEMVLKNFPGAPADEMLERLIELSLYAEEHLR
jgi:hypothetical protein